MDQTTIRGWIKRVKERDGDLPGRNQPTTHPANPVTRPAPNPAPKASQPRGFSAQSSSRRSKQTERS